MKFLCKVLFIALPFVVCVSPLFAQADVDSITFISARPLTGPTIQRGAPVPFEVTLRYTLTSQKTAILSLSTAEFQNPRACVSGGELVSAQDRIVKRGSGEIVMAIFWPGDTGNGSKGRIYNHGSLSFMAMFWKSHHGGIGSAASRERFGLYPFYQDYCVAF